MRIIVGFSPGGHDENAMQVKYLPVENVLNILKGVYKAGGREENLCRVSEFLKRQTSPYQGAAVFLMLQR